MGVNFLLNGLYSPKNVCFYNGTARYQIVNYCLNTNIYSYLETSGGQSSNLYLNVVHFSTPVLIRHLEQLKTVLFPALVSNMCCSIKSCKFLKKAAPLIPDPHRERLSEGKGWYI